MEPNYIAKATHGRESPVHTSMMIGIREHKRADRANVYDVVFYNYLEAIGTKRYCARKSSDDHITFKFYTKSNKDIHRYKLFPMNNIVDFVNGDPIGINVYISHADSDIIRRYITEIKYPVYYLPSNDEYFIKRSDGQRRPLFTNDKKEKTMAKRSLVNIDTEKLKAAFNLAMPDMPMCKLSTSLGLGHSSLGMMLSRGSLTQSVIVAIQAVYNIEPELYVIKEDEPKKTEEKVETAPVIVPELKISEETKQELKNLIYDAVYSAVKKALSE